MGKVPLGARSYRTFFILLSTVYDPGQHFSAWTRDLIRLASLK